MQTTSARGVSNGEVLAIAGAVAGAIGGIAVAIRESRRRRQASHPLISWARQFADDDYANRALASAATVRSRAEAAVRSGAAAAVDEHDRLRRHGRDDAKRARNALGERFRDGGAVVSKDLGKASDMAAQATAKVESLTKRSSKGVRELRSQSGSYSEAGLKRARQVGESVADASRDWVPDLRKRIEKQVIPLVHDVGEGTTERARDLYDSARERTADARRIAERRVAPAAADLASQARDLLGDVSHRAAGEAESLTERLSEASQVAAEKTGAAGRRAQHDAKQVAGAAAQESKDFGSLLLWLGLGGALVYYLFLDERQRDQVQRGASWLFSESRDIYRDIQGHDAEFA